MPGHRSRLRGSLQVIREGFQTGHVGAGPSDTGEDAEQQPGPEPIGDEGEAKMRQRRQCGAEQVNPADRQSVGQRQKQRHRRHISREKDPDEPACIGRREMPAQHVGRQQRREREGAGLRQHLRGDNGTDISAAAR